ncbi:MAG: PD-(D/E)XK nuclease family protein [Candidatus Shikimatogenerans sp. JK-2022]|nr:PD-(D/E)XK nuclease family protein [Candidatus Shikimatogenerans bostrichidophilus]
MINILKKILNKYINKNKKYIFILPNKYYVKIIKNIFININKSKIGIIPNIFYLKEELIEKISNLKITKNNLFFIKILYKQIIKFKKKITKKDIKFLFRLIYDCNLIDKNFINLKLFLKNFINYYNISKWYPNISISRKNNIKLYKLYTNFTNKILNRKKVYYGLALKIAIKNIANFLKIYKKKGIKFIFIGVNLITKSEKIIKQKISKISVFYYLNKKKIIKNKYNKIKIIKTNNNIQKYIILKNIIINNYKRKKTTTIIFTNNLYDDILIKFLKKKYLYKINYNLYYYLDKISLHNFISKLFKIIFYNLKNINFEFILEFFNNIYINLFLNKKKLNKIKFYLNKNNLKNGYINFKIKYIKGTLLYKFIKNRNNIKYLLINFKEIIKILFNKIININKLEYIYLNKIKKLINFLLKIKKHIKINTLYIFFKYYINDNNKISNSNWNINNFIDICNLNFIYKEKIINFYKNNNIILLLNRYYNNYKKKETNFNNRLHKVFNLNINKKKYINKILNIYNIKYVIYNELDKKFNKQNVNILLSIINNNKCNIFNKTNKNNINYKYNKKIILNYNLPQKINKYRKKKGFNFTSLKTYIYNPIDYFYKYILNFYILDNNEPKIFGKIIHKILLILYKKYINVSLNINHIKNIKYRIKNTNIIKKYFYKYFNNIKYNKIVYYNYKITKNFIINFIKNDKKLIEEGNEIKILYLEKFCKIKIFNEIIFTGKIDRIESYNNVYRIIDYKTYYYKNNKYILKYKNKYELNSLFENKLYENILQLLLYILIFTKKKLYKYIYTTIYYPDNIRNLKVNNQIKIEYNFILQFEKILYNYINKIYHKKINYYLSYF